MTSPNDVTEDLVNLCAQHKRSRHHQMFAGMRDGGKRAGERKWACRFYELLASNAPIAEFIPAHQQARAIGDLTEFWSGNAAMEQMAAFLRSLSQKSDQSRRDKPTLRESKQVKQWFIPSEEAPCAAHRWRMENG
jgi:hypothetical protein